MSSSRQNQYSGTITEKPISINICNNIPAGNITNSVCTYVFMVNDYNGDNLA